MTIRSKAILAIIFSSLLSAPMLAQQRDALTEQESDALREVAQEPLKRLKLLIKFATERIDTVDRIKDEPKTVDRGRKLHDALEDFRQIVDELDDNIDDYQQKQSDLRKPLTEVVTAESSFQIRLKAFKDWSEDPKHTVDYKLYSYALQDALESVSLSLADAKKTLDEQNASYAAAKKK
jgi:septal ring factor EnvC (AmiA/AmiB activator)